MARYRTRGSHLVTVGDDSDLWAGDDFGDDDDDDDYADDMEGDVYAGKALARRAPARPPVRRQGGRAVRVRSKFTAIQPSHQTQILPFPSGPGGAATVAALTQSALQTRPQRPFQCQRFAWPSTSSAFFSMQRLTFGVETMFVAEGSISVEVFAQTGVGVTLRGYIAYPGIDVTLTVTNTTGVARAAEALIIGAAEV